MAGLPGFDFAAFFDAFDAARRDRGLGWYEFADELWQRLPDPGPENRLRWGLNQLYAVLNERRQEQGLTWSRLAQEMDCTPSRLTNLRTARMADMALTMRVTQWLAKPAAEFVHATSW